METVIIKLTQLQLQLPAELSLAIIEEETDTATDVKLTEENNVVKMELDAISDLINTGVFEIEMEEGICTEFPLSKA